MTLAHLFVLALCLLASRSLADDEGPKVIPDQKSTKDLIQQNVIPGSSDSPSSSVYVPDKQQSQIGNFVPFVSSNNVGFNTTKSQANVFQVPVATGNGSRDPLLVNAQSPNPFMSQMPGGMDPRVAQILQNNPRLVMLARQNPLVAQQIMRNPAMLRDPAIQRAIQSQLQPGQGQNLLGQLGQLGLRALNPLGLPLGINPMMNRQANPMMNQNQNQNTGLGGLGGRQNQINNQNNGNGFGLPRTQPQANRNQETLPGGFYGNNQNYNPSAENNNGGASEGTGGGQEGGAGEGDSGEGASGEDAGNQDYDGNTGADASGGQDQAAGQDGGQGGGQEGQQDPSEDPDIQQLQNFGGPVNDNFPEGLFPPGLLTKEDMEEIRKQQEKQQKEAEERERQQQQQQNPNAGQDQGATDYGDNTGDDGSGSGEATPQEGAGEEAGAGTDEGANNEAANNVETGEENNQAGGTQGQDPNVATGQVVDLGKQNIHSVPANNPPAFKNSYQAIQPNQQQHQHQAYQPQRPILQSGVDYDHQSPVTNTIGTNPVNGVQQQLKNRFNYQPGVQYDQPSAYPNQNYQQQQATTPAPQFGNTFGYQPQYQPNNFNTAQPNSNLQQNQPIQNQNYGQQLTNQQQQLLNNQFRPHQHQSRLNWPVTPAPIHTNPNQGFRNGLRSNLQQPINRFQSNGYDPNQSNEISNDPQYNDQYSRGNPSPGYRPSLNTFNSQIQQQPRPAYPQHRPSRIQQNQFLA